MENFITVDYLSSLTGCVVIVCMITQFTKELVDKFLPKISTKYVCFFFSFLTILMYQVATKTIFTSNLYVTFINAIIVAITSIATFETVIKKFETKNNL